MWKTVARHVILTKSDWDVLVLPTRVKNWHVLLGQRDGEQAGKTAEEVLDVIKLKKLKLVFSK